VLVRIGVHLSLQLRHNGRRRLRALRPPLLLLLLLLLLQRQHLLPHSLLLELVLLRLNPRLHSLGRLPRVRGRRSALRPHAAHRVHVSVHRDVWRLLQVLGARVLRHGAVVRLGRPGLAEAFDKISKSTIVI
jgi:hypothetical protein